MRTNRSGNSTISCHLGGFWTQIVRSHRAPDAVAAFSWRCVASSNTLLRRAGTHSWLDKMDGGSAAHRHSASKTRVNALMALRSIRGTPLTHPYHANPCI